MVLGTVSRVMSHGDRSQKLLVYSKLLPSLVQTICLNVKSDPFELQTVCGSNTNLDISTFKSFKSEPADQPGTISIHESQIDDEL